MPLSSTLRDLRDRFLGHPRRADRTPAATLLPAIRARAAEISATPDIAPLLASWRALPPSDALTTDVFAAALVAAQRTLGLTLFDEQLLGALALSRGHLVEMQTGEGKTLASTPAIALDALPGDGVHVLTANDYLARRDAEWMGPLYQALGLSVGVIQQDLSPEQRRAAYACDVTYATANEVGFDHLRDGLRQPPDPLIQRGFHVALIDEADSILIDEARIPLVIAGGEQPVGPLAYRARDIARQLRPGRDYLTDDRARNVNLTAHGAQRAEALLSAGSLYDPESLPLLTALNFALHAQELLTRDVDYLVQGDSILLVDEFKGRVAQGRRWPAGLQAAVEAKEDLPLRREGRVLSTLTLQALVGLYGKVCGMTGTAATQADEFRQVYNLDVVVVPTHKPVIRQDHPDVVFARQSLKERELLRAISTVHATGRPILIGTGSVEESERLSSLLTAAAIPHRVLNARQDAEEAAIIAQAGALGAVTVSTNMAGRGTDILLGGNPPVAHDQVVALGGLYVLGTTRHESRRIDHQLRGRAGRQGDPGSSRFFLSLEDELLVCYGIAKLLPWEFRRRRGLDRIDGPEVTAEIDRAQRIIEGEMLQARQLLWKYDLLVERQRRVLYARRREAFLGESDSLLAARSPERYDEWVAGHGELFTRDVERRITLSVIDDRWADYLDQVAEVREGAPLQSFAGKDPFQSYQLTVMELFSDLERSIDDAVVAAFESADPARPADGLAAPGATWTYMVTDQMFGDRNERVARAIRRMLLGRD